MSNNFKKIGLNILILLFQGAYFSVRFLALGARDLLITPAYSISKKLFGKTIIKLYGQFLILKTKINFGGRGRMTNVLLSSHLTHFTIIGVTAVILIINLTVSGQKTFAADEAAPKPIIFNLIESEFAADEQLIVETFDESATVTPEEENYLKNLASVRVQPQAEMKAVGEMETESPESLAYGGSAVVKPNLAQTKKIKRPRTAIIFHTVQPGETVSVIAQEYDISVSTILWENNLTAYSLIRPGDTLAILPASGISYVIQKGDTLPAIAKKYDVAPEEIISFNKLASSGYLRQGQKIIIPGGSKKYTAPSSTSYSGLAALKQLIVPPSAQAVKGNKMNWPTDGHRITQYYNWRHHAVDIANKIGTPIYAADAGTVEAAGWGTGYGNEIVIDHGGGKKTRYAHASRLFVGKGDTVSKGQTIAAMGSTGWSTGPHLHFEIIINNIKYNPLDFIK
ncbi:hypothetical protein COU00_04195 [Candidatus Falkowbacteria bacterium CG10_big_fil_rev_8_21_14_0_10_43_11]|uniref:LysM domain-containing protein n=1 Tax=Candidatus Falkowbacteria bacterium CG10_big_fil_rev_8_21_14_0_10_43_11 TaxID=1974568 RepID=A0A2M6WL01_9BACT|nr:MAG: hypothetical protein COU00_04195 [Candidatus Falkowbacteria bacterium CG10_big_fil_rev_8_21_14_0_10_43_11]